MNDAQAWQDWRDTATDLCALPLVQRLAALLDQDASAHRVGNALPQGWHMILFTPVAPQSSLGADGHPAEQAQFAPAGLPRRLLGGRRTRFQGPLTIGAPVNRVSHVESLQEKQGRSGRLAIVTLRHTITQDGASYPAVVEDQDVIYREAAEAAEATAAAPLPEVPRRTPSHSKAFMPDPALLFRYSAVTFNAHRIHYDHHHATQAEGYPGLIVNGGLTALMLLEMLKPVAGRALHQFDVRNRRPLVCGAAARLCAAPSGDGWDLWAEDEAGRVALEASAT